MHGAVELGLGIVGLVTAWGDVEVHADGFRASHARVAALVNDLRLPCGLAQRLAEQYGVPLISYQDWLDDDFIAEFGEIVPVEMRPPLQPHDWAPSSRRKRGARSMTIVPVTGAILMASIHSWVPMVIGIWHVVLVTLSTMLWPDWWDR